jgi:hypothetical protein
MVNKINIMINIINIIVVFDIPAELNIFESDITIYLTLLNFKFL